MLLKVKGCAGLSGQQGSLITKDWIYFLHILLLTILGSAAAL